jgi:hypothetical protein
MNHRRNVLLALALGVAGCARAPRDAAPPGAAPVAPTVSAPENKEAAADGPRVCSGDSCEDPDPDRDGIRGAEDKCPTYAEKFDGVHDHDGCPG